MQLPFGRHVRHNEGYRATVDETGDTMAAENQSTQQPTRTIVVKEGQQVVARPQPFRTTPASQAQRPTPRPR